MLTCSIPITKYSNMKERILQLRSEGKTYKQIVDEVGCAKSTVAYYCNLEYQKSAKERHAQNKKNDILGRKIENFKSLRRLKNKSERFQFRNNDAPDKRNPYNKNNLKFNAKDVLNMIEKNPFCYLTGEPLDIYDPKSIALDHKIPVSRGGQNTIDNLGICSYIANQSKAALTVEEFIELCSKVLINFGYTVSKN